MRVFDFALIGAGPTGYAALTAMRGFSGSLVVITGATPESGLGSSAKFASVAFERQRPASFAEPVVVSGKAPKIFSAAEVGGLANYWGKQLQVYEEGDPWGQGQFLETWKDYRAACDAVQSDLEVIGGSERQHLDGGLATSVPRLLVGTSTAPGTNLEAMAHAVERRFEEMGDLEVRSERVQRIEEERDCLRLELGGGTQIRARHVFLAAGVLGTASLLARSLPRVTETGFRDHVPYTLKCFGLRRAFGPPSSYYIHGDFNALALKRIQGGRCSLYASVYAVSQAPVSLLTAAFGLGPRMRGRRVGPAIDLIQPVRIWTPETLVQNRHLHQQSRIEANPAPDPRRDQELQLLHKWLSAQGVRSLHGSTAPGQGFHYHNLTVGEDQQPVDEVVEPAFSGRLRVINASCLPQIGCPPHTLTAMAQAFARVRHDLARAKELKPSG